MSTQTPWPIRQSGATAGSPGHILQLLRSGAATTRPQLVELTKASRSAISQRVDALIEAGLVVEDGPTESTGGRPAQRLRFAPDRGVVLVAALGATRAHIAITDLVGAVQAELVEDLSIGEGPKRVLDWVREKFDALLEQLGLSPDVIVGIGVGLPGPVEHSSGRAVSPPIMPGWDAYPVPDHFADLDVPVLVDNDVNIMALGEYWASWRTEVDDLLFIKVGTGIGCGIVASGSIHRGSQGAAGDLGHVQLHGNDEATCGCGNVGCVEAVAGGRAIADALRQKGYDTHDARAVVELVVAGDREATRLVREAGRLLGQVVAAAVNFFNPSVIVIGGDIADAHEQLLAGVREVVYQRSLPLATRNLRLVPAKLGAGAGVRGAATMVVEHVLAPAAVDQRVSSGGGRH